MTTEQVYTLDQVLKEQNRIFSDSSIYRHLPGVRDWYKETVYGRDELHQLDLAKLAEVRDSLEREISWWCQPQTFSTGKIVEEKERFNQILRRKLDYFRDKLGNRNKELRQRASIAMYGHPYPQICHSYETILHKAFASLYEPKEEDVFAALEHFVIEIGKETSAKKDFSERHGDRRRGKNKVDLHADEQVVASAIYSSVVEKTPCAIVTPDSDHQRLLAEVQKYVHQREDLGPMSKALLENPVQVYFVQSEETVWFRGATSSPESFTK